MPYNLISHYADGIKRIAEDTYGIKSDTASDALQYLYNQEHVKYLFGIGFSIPAADVTVIPGIKATTSFPFSMHIDMADYMGVTQEGKDGYVTVYVKGGFEGDVKIYNPLDDFRTLINATKSVVPSSSSDGSTEIDPMASKFTTDARPYSLDLLKDQEDNVFDGLYGDFLDISIPAKWPSDLPVPPGYNLTAGIDVFDVGVTTSFELRKEDVENAFTFDSTELSIGDIFQNLWSLDYGLSKLAQAFVFRTASDDRPSVQAQLSEEDRDGYLLPYYDEQEPKLNHAATEVVTNNNKEVAEDIWPYKVLNSDEKIVVHHKLHDVNDTDWFKLNTSTSGTLEVRSEYIPFHLDRPGETPQWTRGGEGLFGDTKIYDVKSGGTQYFEVKAVDEGPDWNFLNKVPLGKTFDNGTIETSVWFYPERLQAPPTSNVPPSAPSSDSAPEDTPVASDTPPKDASVPANLQILPGAPPTGSAPELVDVALKDLPAPPPVPAPPSTPPPSTEESAPAPPASDMVQDLGGERPSGDDTTEDEKLAFDDFPPPPDMPPPPPPSFSPKLAPEPDARPEAPSSDTVQDLGGNEPTPDRELSFAPPPDDVLLV